MLKSTKLLVRAKMLDIRVWIILLIFIQALVLFAMDRIPICKCGFVKFWHGIVFSSENSQHLTDWYTFSHIIHGFAFYLIFWWIGKRWNWPVGLRLFFATLVEVVWEVFENTPMVINHYRAVTISLDYYGDSIINSISDTFAMVFGFYLAYKLPVWVIIGLVILMEVLVGYFIRDNLTLNIIMLIYSFEWIKTWQSGA